MAQVIRAMTMGGSVVPQRRPILHNRSFVAINIMCDYLFGWRGSIQLRACHPYYPTRTGPFLMAAFRVVRRSVR